MTTTKTNDKPNNIKYPVKCNGGYLDKAGFLAKENFESKNLSICVDWFQVNGTCKIPQPLQMGEGERFEFGDIILLYTGHGSELFQAVFEVYLGGERVCILQAHPRHTLQPDVCSLKLENAVLYYEDWLQLFFEIVGNLQFSVKNITRLDIAVDGHAGIVEFMNCYMKQQEMSVKMKGKATLKSNFEASTQKFTWFQIGSSASDKCISIYNKTKELAQSNKIYIQRFWEKNNLIQEQETDIYRIELRLKSKALKDLPTFDIQHLNCHEYLASICQTHFENFFQFYYNEDSNSSRCEEIDIINWERLGASLLDKCKKKQVNDAYKAKLTIHLLIKLHYQDLISEKLKHEAMPYIQTLLFDFDLQDWYNHKIEDWKKSYCQPTNKKIVTKYLLDKLKQKWIFSVVATTYLDTITQNELSQDYEICKSLGFYGDWYAFKDLVSVVLNELETKN